MISSAQRKPSRSDINDKLEISITACVMSHKHSKTDKVVNLYFDGSGGRWEAAVSDVVM